MRHYESNVYILLIIVIYIAQFQPTDHCAVILLPINCYNRIALFNTVATVFTVIITQAAPHYPGLGEVFDAKLSDLNTFNRKYYV